MDNTQHLENHMVSHQLPEYIRSPEEEKQEV